MGKRRKNRAERPASLEELLTQKVSEVLDTGQITPAQVYDLLLLGNRCYRQGVGLPHNAVWKSILDGFKDHDRYYLTPGQNAALHGREEPTPEDFEHLNA